ncbi:helix-turn-helix domain-containing protein [Streptomyces sp. NPDC002499]
MTALTEHPYPLGTVELAKFVGLSPGSVHRLLVTLVSVGWVERTRGPVSTGSGCGVGAAVGGA